jgi:hypothetical protein
MHPAPSTVLAAVTAARQQSQGSPSGSGAPELPIPHSRARRPELVRMMADRNLDSTDLTVVQMRETLRQADHTLRPPSRNGVPGLSKMLKADLMQLARTCGIDVTGMSAEQLRLALQGWVPKLTKLSDPAASSKTPTSPSKLPAGLPSEPSAPSGGERPSTVRRTPGGRRVCTKCNLGMLVDEDEKTGQWVWLCPYAGCLGPREAPLQAEDEDFWLRVGDVQDIVEVLA